MTNKYEGNQFAAREDP